MCRHLQPTYRKAEAVVSQHNPGVGRVGAEGAGAPAARRKRATPRAEKRPGTPAAVAGRGQTATATATQEGS